MIIPDKIELLGSVIRTVYDQQLLDEVGEFGRYIPGHNEIVLAKNYKNKEMNNDHLFELYVHELIHAMFDKLGYEEINEDEKLIKGFSNLLVQVLKQLK